MENTRVPNGETRPGVGELVHRITNDVKTIASDELELAKIELGRSFKSAAADGAMVILGGIVALIGFAMLCVAAVDALGAVIEPLWARLLMMSALYLVAGGIITRGFVKKLAHDTKPDMSLPIYEAKATVDNIKEGLDADDKDDHAH